MCKFKSALCLKDRVFVPDYDSHDQMLKELGIPDDYMHASKVFVRVELSPEDGDPTSDPMGWRINIDQDILPDWFDHKVDEQRVKEAIADWCKVHVLCKGHHEVQEGTWIAPANSTVTARGNSTVTARGNSTVTAWANSTVTARDNSTVTARDNSTVTARANSTVAAWGNSTVTAWDNSTVTAWANSTVILPVYCQTEKPVEMHDEAICINHNTHKIRSAINWEEETV